MPTAFEMDVDGTNQTVLSRVQERKKLFLSISYCLSMGVCGIILVAIGLTLSDLAKKIGVTAQQLGSIFILRGCGAVGGSILSAGIYRNYPGNMVISCALLALATCTIILPFNKTYLGIHVLFLILGLGTAITDTGCQIMTRKLHGEKAGPFLGLNTVAFGVSGSLVPLISFISDDSYCRFFMLTFIILAVLVAMLLSPDPANMDQSESCIIASDSLDAQELDPTWSWSQLHNSEGTMILSPRHSSHSASSRSASPSESSKIAPSHPSSSHNLPPSHTQDVAVPHYFTEMAISGMVFCLIGGKVTVTAYLDAYVAQTKVIDPSIEHRIMLAFWICVTLGRVVGIYNQRYFTNTSLPTHLFAAALAGSLFGAALLTFPTSSALFWVGIPLYGLCNGPCLGYCYDLNNRLTYSSEASMSIVMFGLNLGASLVPYFTSVAWKQWNSPRVLLVVVLLSTLLPVPLLLVALRASYITADSAVPPAPTKYRAINNAEIDSSTHA